MTGTCNPRDASQDILIKTTITLNNFKIYNTYPRLYKNRTQHLLSTNLIVKKKISKGKSVKPISKIKTINEDKVLNKVILEN